MSGVICNMLHTRCATSALSSTIDVISRASLSATCQSHSSPLVWVAFLPGLNFLFPHPLIFSYHPRDKLNSWIFCVSRIQIANQLAVTFTLPSKCICEYTLTEYILVVTLVQCLLSRNYSQVSFKRRNLFNYLYNLKTDRIFND